MRKALVSEKNGRVTVTDADDPSPGAGEVLVAVRAIGVNYIDEYHRTGFYPTPFPLALGREGAGDVVAVGDGVTDWQVGARVAWVGVQGSYATHICAPSKELVAVPDDVTCEQAAAAMLQGMTAHYLTTDTFPLHPHHTCLVHAAAGGVGLLLCQMAKRRGARVIGVVGSAQKAALASGAGADHVIVRAAANFREEAKRLTDGRGVDVVYDSVGKDTFDDSLACVRARGMLVCFGQSSGGVPPVDVLRLSAQGSVYLTRATLHHYTATRAELEARATAVLTAVGSGALVLRVDRTMPLEEADAALALLTSRATMGKLLLIP